MGNDDFIEKLTVPALVVMVGLVLWGALAAVGGVVSSIEGTQAAQMDTMKRLQARR